MNLDFLQVFSGLIAAISVALTVIYLAVQIKRNTKATYSQTYQFATQALAEMAATVGRDKDTARIFAIGMASPEKLEESEYYQFAYLGISLIRRYENVFFQYKSGMIDDDFWDGHRENLLWFYHQPGFQKLWEERRLGFSKILREFLESTSSEELKTSNVRRV
ncbi:MAG: hypothetical protein H8E39_07150 [Alphaproteobacteria bacterium]|nr:hypothetical protein [Alphaproteobacteria bacterium]